MRLEGTLVNATQDSSKLVLQTHSSFGVARFVVECEVAGRVGGASMSSQMASTRIEVQCTPPPHYAISRVQMLTDNTDPSVDVHMTPWTRASVALLSRASCYRLISM